MSSALIKHNKSFNVTIKYTNSSAPSSSVPSEHEVNLSLAHSSGPKVLISKSGTKVDAMICPSNEIKTSLDRSSRPKVLLSESGSAQQLELSKSRSAQQLELSKSGSARLLELSKSRSARLLEGSSRPSGVVGHKSMIKDSPLYDIKDDKRIDMPSKLEEVRKTRIVREDNKRSSELQERINEFKKRRSIIEQQIIVKEELLKPIQGIDEKFMSTNKLTLLNCSNELTGINPSNTRNIGSINKSGMIVTMFTPYEISVIETDLEELKLALHNINRWINDLERGVELNISSSVSRKNIVMPAHIREMLTSCRG